MKTRNSSSSSWRRFKTILIVFVISIIIGYFLFSGSEPPLPVDAEAIRLGREALVMLDDAQSSKRTLEVVEVLLMGMGYVVSICVPAGVVCFFIYTCRKE